MISLGIWWYLIDLWNWCWYWWTIKRVWAKLRKTPQLLGSGASDGAAAADGMMMMMMTTAHAIAVAETDAEG